LKPIKESIKRMHLTVGRPTVANSARVGGRPQLIRHVGSERMMNKDALTTALAHFISEMERQAGSTHEAEDRSLYDKFLAKAGVIMAKVEQDQPIGDDVATTERMFGHTWFKDEDAYTRIYAEWDTFKRLLTQSLHGMTVNERLFSLGLLEEFDKAVAKHDESRLRAVLFKCYLDDDNVEAIIRQQLKEG
jgi:hypothetical protein